MLELFAVEIHSALKEALKLSGKGQTVKPINVKGKHSQGEIFDTTIEVTRTEIDGGPAVEIVIRNDSDIREAEAQEMQAQAQTQIDLLSQKLAASVQQLAARARNLDLLTGFINPVT